MQDLFKQYEPALLDHLLQIIYEKSDTAEPATETYLLSKTTSVLPDRIALGSALFDINKFDPYLVEKGEFIRDIGHLYYAGKGLEEFLEAGGFQGIIERKKIEEIKVAEREKLELENLQTSIASGKAAVESEKHAKSSKYAAWAASVAAILAILTSIGIAWWQGEQNEDLKRRLEILEKERPVHDTLIIKGTSK